MEKENNKNNELKEFREIINLLDENIENLYFYITILYFIYYINNFPKLKNEKINRIKFYSYNLFEKINKLNLDQISINFENDKFLLITLEKLFKNQSINQKNKFIKVSFLTLIITLLTYKEIANLISKKNIFTKKIEVKILKIINIIIKNTKKHVENYYYSYKNLNINAMYDMVNSIVSDNFILKLRNRQKFRSKCLNFIEYKNNINEFNIISNKEQLIEKYKNIINNSSNIFTYEKEFVLNFNDFLDQLTKD